MRVVITNAPFSPQAELAAFTHANAGAMASFVGYCRPTSDNTAVERLELDHYPGFTEAEIQRLSESVSNTPQPARSPCHPSHWIDSRR